MKYLYQLNNESLKILIEQQLYLKNWFVRQDDIVNRKDKICYSERFNLLKNRATELQYSFSDTEIVSWLDTLTTMYYVFNNITDQHIKDNIVILQEYCIPFSNKRADYLLVLDNQILIVEFSFQKIGYEFQYETKLQQAIGYKELLSNLLPKEIDIGTYTFLLEAEEDKNRKIIKIIGTEQLANNAKIDMLAQYIEHFFNKSTQYAYNSLNKLE